MRADTENPSALTMQPDRDGTRPHRIGTALVAALLSLGAGLLIGLTGKSKASALVVFADGSVHERKLDGKTAIGQAQRDAVRHNALAAAATSLAAAAVPRGRPGDAGRHASYLRDTGAV